jgi:hypothetical protein
MKQQADKRRHNYVLEVGDWVFLKLQPYRQSSMFWRAQLKLAGHFFGPYQILERIGEVAYKLALPETAKIHHVFHVSLLKKVGDVSMVICNLPPFSAENSPILEPMAIQDYRWVKHGHKYITEALVQWKTLPLEDATWEEVNCLRQQFPNIDLEDKVRIQGGVGAIDENHSYQRKKRKSKPNPRYLD